MSKFNLRRHIHQKSSADCALASMAMFHNIPWETIKDLFVTEILYYRFRIDMDENDPNYFDELFNEAFPSDNSDMIEGASGLTNSDKYYLNTLLGLKSNFIETPYLVPGIPCLISTGHFIKEDNNPVGHAMFFDGQYIYDPAMAPEEYKEDDPLDITNNLLYSIPPFGRCLYMFNDSSLIPKHLAAINNLINHTSPNDKIPFTVILCKDFDKFSPDNYETLYVSSLEKCNEVLEDEFKFPEITYEQFLEKYPAPDRPYFNSTMANEEFVPYEKYKQEGIDYFKEIIEEDRKNKGKIKNNPYTIKAFQLPKELYTRNYKKKSNPLSQYQLQRFAYAVHAVLSEWYHSLPDDKSPETYSLYSSKSSFSHYFTIKGKVFRLSDHSSGEIRIDGGRKRIRSHDLTHVNSFVKQLESVLRNTRDIPYLNRIKELQENLIKSASSGKEISKKKSLDRMAYKKIELSRLINDIMTGKVDDILSELLDIDGQWRKDRFIRFYYLVGKNYEISKVDAQELYKNLTENKNFSDYAYSVTNKRYKNNPGKIKTHTRAKKKTYKRARKK